MQSYYMMLDHIETLVDLLADIEHQYANAETGTEIVACSKEWRATNRALQVADYYTDLLMPEWDLEYENEYQ